MSNASAHALGAASALGVAHVLVEMRDGHVTALPLVTAAAGSLLGSLPDYVEPPLHPNHRQFFHSWLFAASLAVGMVKLWKWEPNDDWGKFLKYAGLVGGGAYLVHLAMDARTRKSLPFVGTLST